MFVIGLVASEDKGEDMDVIAKSQQSYPSIKLVQKKGNSITKHPYVLFGRKFLLF